MLKEWEERRVTRNHGAGGKKKGAPHSQSTQVPQRQGRKKPFTTQIPWGGGEGWANNSKSTDAEKKDQVFVWVVGESTEPLRRGEVRQTATKKLQILHSGGSEQIPNRKKRKAGN